MRNKRAVKPAQALKQQMQLSTGGYRETMIRLISSLKQHCRYHDNTYKLMRSDITIRNFVRAVEDAAIITSPDVVRELFTGKQVFALPYSLKWHFCLIQNSSK